MTILTDVSQTRVSHTHVVAKQIINCPGCGEAVGPRPQPELDIWDCHHPYYQGAFTPLVRSSTVNDPTRFRAICNPRLIRDLTQMTVTESEEAAACKKTESSTSTRMVQPCLDVSIVEQPTTSQLLQPPIGSENLIQQPEGESQAIGNPSKQSTEIVSKWARCCLPDCSCSSQQAHDD